MDKIRYFQVFLKKIKFFRKLNFNITATSNYFYVHLENPEALRA